MEKSIKEAAYTESRTLRDEAINTTNYDFLDKVKAVQYLTEDMILSVAQIAEYYEVSENTIKTIISRNRDEFEHDGIVIMSGDELRKFKENMNWASNETQLFGKRAVNLMVLTKRSLLRVGLIMTNCSMAARIRNYLLNLEEVATVDQKSWAVQREVGIIERKRMTSAIKKYLPDDEHKKFAYPKYTNTLYLELFGKTAEQLRIQWHVKTNDALRDSFTESELAAVEEGETIITALVCLGFTYEQIRRQLSKKYVRQDA